uniref:Uncharacterized protein n=1 Tax=Romanomermis culicivorax TaxID=13658 RepID=A0A915K6P5_ROMCU
MLNFRLQFSQCYDPQMWNGRMQAYADACNDRLRCKYSVFTALHAIEINSATASLQHQLYDDITTAVE